MSSFPSSACRFDVHFPSSAQDCNAVQIYEVISNPFSLSVSLKDHQSTNILGINSEAINTLYHKLVQTKTRLFNGILFRSLRTLCWCFETLIKSNQDVPLRAIPFLLLVCDSLFVWKEICLAFTVTVRHFLGDLFSIK